MTERDEFLAEVRDRLEQAQQHYKSVYDRRHRPVEFVPDSGFGCAFFIGPLPLFRCKAVVNWGRNSSGHKKWQNALVM